MSTATVFLAVSDNAISKPVMTHLTGSGYNVISFDSLENLLFSLKNNEADIILCGIDLNIGKLRAATDRPFIAISESTAISDKIRAYQAGCDEYLTWPLEPVEIELHINACIKRINRSNNLILEFPPLIINIKSRKVTLNNKEVRLTNREFEILSFLAEMPNRTVSTPDIYSRVWDDDTPCDNHLVMVNVSYLRKKFSQIAPEINFIRTQWGQGYSFVYPPDRI
ncbi:DNA-binding response regulator, OmpR family, contains REC and winged-helix (wHTH) domain [Ruminococcaceae bacterium YRB3002]|nr:DNA-binding response regulator, OmpR family, contains REC and winged-helix (wHTH) domain [Ruminococcaceae bacterium YRB3002]